ncbi:MAG: hypothetical protein CL605_05995 [Altibacter sp.]|nr:hypothetical protein [Altibacter sp.]
MQPRFFCFFFHQWKKEKKRKKKHNHPTIHFNTSLAISIKLILKCRILIARRKTRRTFNRQQIKKQTL